MRLLQGLAGADLPIGGLHGSHDGSGDGNRLLQG